MSLNISFNPNYYFLNSAQKPQFKKIDQKSNYNNLNLSPVSFARSGNLNYITFKGTSSDEIKEKLNRGEKVPYKVLLKNYNELKEIFEKPLTPFDTDEIILRRKQAAKTYIESVKPPEFDAPEREKFKQNLAKKLYEININNRKHERKAVIIFGLPGVGKTSCIATDLAEKMNALLIDGDLTRELEPQYIENAAHKHYKEEQKSIEKMVREKAIKNGDNFIHNIVYREENPDQLRNILRQLRQNKYDDVKLIFLDLPVEKAATRVINRFEKTNRFMDPLEVYCLGDTPRRIYEELRNENCFDSYELYSNDVPIGAAPKLMENIQNIKNKQKHKPFNLYFSSNFRKSS
ncbi:MAG TPA: zeta toxin family protein [Candidatus Gastranaerophilales bacterium]|nr:zeta toxin family protein [Candidatus Gastranaerophilales bacterium]